MGDLCDRPPTGARTADLAAIAGAPPEAVTEHQLQDAEARCDRAPDHCHQAEQPLALHSGSVVVPIAGYLASGLRAASWATGPGVGGARHLK